MVQDDNEFAIAISWPEGLCKQKQCLKVQRCEIFITPFIANRHKEWYVALLKRLIVESFVVHVIGQYSHLILDIRRLGHP